MNQIPPSICKNKHTFFTVYIFLILSFFSTAQVQISAVNTTPITCPNNGTITVNATSTNLPLLYSIISGPVTQPVQTNPTFNSLLPGNYTIKVTDGLGFETTAPATISGTYVNPNFTVTAVKPDCVGNSDGEITATILSGTGSAPFNWEVIAPSPVLFPPQNSSTFNNLPAGNYSVQVTDSCSSVRLQTITLIPPSTTMSVGGLSAEKIGCDSMLIRYTIYTNEPKFPLSFNYLTTNGTFIPSGGTTIDSSHAYTLGQINIEQIIPNMTYGHYVRTTITNACGDQTMSGVLYTYPFAFYPVFRYNQCGDTATVFYENPPIPPYYHTYLKSPVTYTYIDLSTNDTVASGTRNASSIVGIAIYNVSAIGKTY